MSISKILNRYFSPFFSRTVSWNTTDALIAIFQAALKGAESAIELRNLLLNLYETKEVLLVDSGSTAIVIALEVLKKKFPDRNEIVIPVYICPSVVRTILSCKLIPRFAGITPDLMIDPSDMEQCLNSRTLAVLIPHINGYPAPIDRCIELIKKNSDTIGIIDDAAAAFGNEVKNNLMGTKGDFGIISFGQAKMLAAAGGGAVLINNPKLVNDCRAYYQEFPVPDFIRSVHGIKKYWWEFGQRRYSRIISYYWDRVFPSSDVKKIITHRKMNDIQAALILSVMDKYLEQKKQRCQIISYYINELKEYDNIEFPQPLASDYGVTRLLFRVTGLRLTRSYETIIRDNPLVLYLKKNNIIVSYGYHQHRITWNEKELSRWEDFSFLDELIWLPVDYMKENFEYKEVVRLIRNYISNRSSAL